MPIVSSQVLSTNVQRDGRAWVIEQHLDQFGTDHRVTWLAGADLQPADIAAVCSARDAVISAGMAAAEIAANLSQAMTQGQFAVVTFNESTAAQNAAAVRAAYASMTRTDAIFTGEFLGTLANNQLQTAFGLTAGQVTTLRANFLTPAATLAASIRANVGT